LSKYAADSSKLAVVGRTSVAADQLEVTKVAETRPGIALGSWAFAFGPFADDPWDFDRLCRYAVAAGYEGVEINGFRPHPHDLDYSDYASCAGLRDRLAELGLGISGYAPDFHSTPPARVAHGDYLARVDSVLAFCRRLGIATLRVDSVSAPGPFDRERFDHLVSVWRQAADRCADSGVLLVWEFEPGFWLNRPNEVLDLLGSVDHPNFKVLYDTSHAYAGAVAGARQGQKPQLLRGGDVEYARLLAPWLGHLHLIDGDGSLHDEQTSAHLPFGTGNIAFDAVLGALGPAVAELPWWTVDFCFCPTTEADAVTAVKLVRELAVRTGKALTR
jgi:sugar phosphate isomerase/epimerase